MKNEAPGLQKMRSNPSSPDEFEYIFNIIIMGKNV